MKVFVCPLRRGTSYSIRVASINYHKKMTVRKVWAIKLVGKRISLDHDISSSTVIEKVAFFNLLDVPVSNAKAMHKWMKLRPFKVFQNDI